MFDNRNDFQFTQQNAGSYLPGNPGVITAEMIANLNSNDFGMTASNTGSQNPLQSLVFNPPTINDNGMGSGGGFNLDGISTIGKTLGSLGMLYNSFQQQKLAKESFNFQKDSYKTNLANQTKSYNTGLEDRANARYFQQNGTAQEAADYFNKNRL